MIKRTFLARGVEYASKLALLNVIDLEKIIDWNIGNDLLLYRMSSDMFPWMSEYELEDLPDITDIANILARIGAKVREHDLRLAFHPGPFNVLASRDQNVVLKTIKELRQHAEIMDVIGLPRSPFAKINIHLGGAYGNRREAIARFIDNLSLLPDSARTRLTIENDDRPNMFSVGDLMMVYDATAVPIVFDYHHHLFRSGDLTTREGLELALTTWPSTITPIVHVSSSRKQHEDQSASAASHADFIYESFTSWGHRVDVMLEAKAKEMAVFRFRESVLSA